jgi:hypothetical protein
MHHLPQRQVNRPHRHHHQIHRLWHPLQHPKVIINPPVTFICSFDNDISFCAFGLFDQIAVDVALTSTPASVRLDPGGTPPSTDGPCAC